MKAIKLVGAMNLQLMDLPQPQPDGHNVIIKVDKCSICGSDFHFSYEDGDSPRLKGSIPGHEYSGIVVDPGANKKLKVRDRFIPLVAIVAPVLCYVLQTNSEAWFGGYKFSYELLIFNGLFTFVGLCLLIRKKQA